MEKKSLFLVSISDYFTKEFILLSLVPFLFSVGLFIGLYISLVDVPSIEGSFFSDIFDNTLSLLLYALGGIASIMLSLLSAIIIIGFLTPFAVKIIHKRHYEDVEHVSSITFMHSLLFFAKIFAKFLALLILFMPLYFIPAINALAIQVLFFYLFHTLLIFDVGSNIFSASEYKKFKKERGFFILATNVVLFLISQIPFVGLLIPLFTVIVIAHIAFRYKKAAHSAQ